MAFYIQLNCIVYNNKKYNIIKLLLDYINNKYTSLLEENKTNFHHLIYLLKNIIINIIFFVFLFSSSLFFSSFVVDEDWVKY
jgi:hypothetical protein